MSTRPSLWLPYAQRQLLRQLRVAEARVLHTTDRELVDLAIADKVAAYYDGYLDGDGTYVGRRPQFLSGLFASIVPEGTDSSGLGVGVKHAIRQDLKTRETN
jgi:hypothetical protein